jgi:fructan beta-fructosidase
MNLLLSLAAAAGAADDIVIADFEGPDYGDWKAEGEAFGPGPAQGTLPGQMTVSGYDGRGLVNSYFSGDGTTGTLTSPEFEIARKHLVFLIGGGGWVNRTCMNLVVGTSVVRTATGQNTEPGGSEELAPASWDVGEFMGRTAHLEIIDRETGGWGHVNVDRIAQSDRPAPPVARPGTLEREIPLKKQYLLFPVRNGAENDRKQLVSVQVGGATVRKFDMGMSDRPDWFAHLDVSAWQGQTAVVRVERIAEDSKAVDSIEPSDTPWRADGIYSEPLRGQFHFSPRRGWNNDPNGLVHADGEYHLYFQHNPYGWSWGNMHWGHAVSRDMVHWRELPIALYPHQYSDWVFSGSAVVDKDNTSGWRKGTNSLIVAAFTSTARGECIAYSTDGGRTFAEHDGNPVVKHAGRDPRLLWHAASRQWVMAVYDEFEGGRFIAFYTSPDLKAWTFQSRIADFFECPDIFELPVCSQAREGSGERGTRLTALTTNVSQTRWVLTAASSDYMVGAFDGKTFTPATPKLTGHRGRGFYAAQTFSQEPQGRVVQIGWLQTTTPGMPFNQSMSLPNELRLLATPEGPRLTWTPVKELESLRAASHALGPLQLAPGEANPLAGVRGELLEIRAEFAPGNAAEIAFAIRGARVVYDCAKQDLSINDHRAPAPLRDGRQRLAIFVDRTALELFASDGLTYVPMPFAANPNTVALELSACGGTAQFQSLQVYELKSAWP